MEPQEKTSVAERPDSEVVSDLDRGAAAGGGSAIDDGVRGSVELLGPIEIRELAGQLNVSPTKKLGQNFVHDPNTVRKIVADAEVGATDTVVEIGPGLGSLTLALLEVVDHVIAVEIDRKLAAQLANTVGVRAVAKKDRLSVVTADAMKVRREDLAPLAASAPTALVANLPYNVSVPVLMHMLHEFPTIDRVLVMVQLEVADRLAANSGTKIYGVPSVKARFYGEVARVATVGKNVFWPAPKVDSGLVRIDRWGTGDMPPAPWDAEIAEHGLDKELVRQRAFEITDAAFLQRRKTLRAALSKYFGSGATSEKVLLAAEIDPSARGEKLATEDFVHVAIVSLVEGIDGVIPGRKVSQ